MLEPARSVNRPVLLQNRDALGGAPVAVTLRPSREPERSDQLCFLTPPCRPDEDLGGCPPGLDPRRRVKEKQQKSACLKRSSGTRTSVTPWLGGRRAVVSTPELHSDEQSESIRCRRAKYGSELGVCRLPAQVSIALRLRQRPGGGVKILNQPARRRWGECQGCRAEPYARHKELVGDRDRGSTSFSIQVRGDGHR